MPAPRANIFDAHSVTEALRVPPHSQEAEQSVLGGVLIDNTTWDQVADQLVEEDFYQRDHRIIFRAVASLSEKNTPFDIITLSEWLSSHGELADAGGLAYLSILAKETPSAANIHAYIKIVRERSILRLLIQAGHEISGIAYFPEGREAAELLDLAEQRIFSISERRMRAQRGFQTITELSIKALDRIESLYQKPYAITGLPAGFKDLDELTSGLQPADLVIVAGRPSMGKTSFAMNIVEYVAVREKKAVAVFSMEMPAEQLALRMIAAVGRIDQQLMRTGKLNPEDWPKITSAVGTLTESTILIDDTPSLSPTELRARCRRLKRERGLDLVVIDYLQLMESPGTRENRATEISEISRNLKLLARELSIPVVALSQLNRGLEQRPNKRPMMSDLRESGAIEQDADLILFIYRDEVYNEESPDKGIAEIIIGKQRNGPIGTIRLTFLSKYTRFENFIATPLSHENEG